MSSLLIHNLTFERWRTALAALGVLCCLAWTSAVQAVVLRDDRQQDVVVDSPPQRVVSLLPSLTEIVCALGQCDKLVGVDRYSNWPASVSRLPRLGGGLDPDIEKVVSLQPDLVLLATSTRGADRLQALGVKVMALEPRTYADVQRVLQTVGQALQVPSAQRAQVWREMDAALAEAARSLPESLKGQRVYVEVSPVPYGASEASFIGETLQRLGLRNILPAELGPFPQINPEFVVRADPDFILLGESSLPSLLKRPGWSGLKAVREGHYCVFTQPQADVLVRPGPRMAEGARLIAQCLMRPWGNAARGLP